MTVPTHILMGRAIAHIIDDTLPARLNKRWFLYGNIYPDISHYMRTIPHFSRVSMPFVKRLIQSLCRTPVGPGGRIDPILSLQLGMLCHYVCDFFCHVHSSSFTGTKKNHLTYELAQHAIIARRPNSFIHDATPITNGLLMCNHEEIWSWLDEEQAKYTAAVHSKQEDLSLAIDAAARVATSVLAMCLLQEQTWMKPVPAIA